MSFHSRLSRLFNVVVTGRTPDTNLFSAGLVTPEASAVTSSPSSGCIEPGGSHVNTTSVFLRVFGWTFLYSLES